MATLVSVYLDACCFIEIVKHEASATLATGRENEVWFIKKLLQAHRDREINVYTSVISIAECLHIGTTPVPENVQKRFDALLNSAQYVHLIQTTPFICMDARNLRWKENIALKGADGIHLASALDRQCAEFISLDGRFERISEHNNFLDKRGLSVRIPSSTVTLPEKYKQVDSFEDGQDKTIQ